MNFTTKFYWIGAIIFTLLAIGTITYAKTMNQIALEATTASFYDEQVAL